MTKVGLFAGSFDPVTLGHIDLIQRASRLFDHLYVVIMTNSSKNYLFSFVEKENLLQQALAAVDCPNVTVLTAANQLVVTVAQKVQAQFLVRGLRGSADLDYELAMQEINHLQDRQLETVYLVARPQYAHISSSMVKEVAHYGGQVAGLVPPVVATALAQKKAER
ncbi:pantetheine-phosphate adenylyltransferase [Lactobacillus sp. DCY120]|uniref:Phosphopantetheine adenylyltransferase n=1 Tax=Bombilactobacillus apium TaxID=2675299 RepID=A0A850R544_9LACO|nr:pantetheine-phosphate adenylyltransferase [Bombilactobacillus apium]NVY95712.1 pantetheine-phosphate adenylyltransferase [Bombilactobacillus apium]